MLAIETQARPGSRTALAFGAAALGAACLLLPAIGAAQTAYGHRAGSDHKSALEARETVEDRITTLHRTLMITPDQEAKWTAVAQVMRDNEAEMQRMISEGRSDADHQMTAVEDLRRYERFTQAHVNGLRSLIAAFETLYTAMPASQQTVADGVFRHFGGHDRAVRS